MVELKKSEDSDININQAVSEAFGENIDEKTKVNNVFKLLGIVAVILGVGFGGYQIYSMNQQAKQAEAVVEFDALQNAHMSNNLAGMKASASKLIDNYPDNPLSVRGALVIAKANFEAKDYKSAKAQLEWAGEHTQEQDIKTIAKLRLTKVLIEENQLDQAITLLSQISPDGYEVLIDDTKGDIFALKNDQKQAKQFYQQALNRLTDKSNPLRALIEMKMVSLNGHAIASLEATPKANAEVKPDLPKTEIKLH